MARPLVCAAFWGAFYVLVTRKAGTFFVAALFLDGERTRFRLGRKTRLGAINQAPPFSRPRRVAASERQAATPHGSRRLLVFPGSADPPLFHAPLFHLQKIVWESSSASNAVAYDDLAVFDELSAKVAQLQAALAEVSRALQSHAPERGPLKPLNSATFFIQLDQHSCASPRKLRETKLPNPKISYKFLGAKPPNPPHLNTALPLSHRWTMWA